MMTQAELQEVKEYVLINLPAILEQEPKFVYFVEGIVNEKFPRKDEFSRLLDQYIKDGEDRRNESRKIREEMHKEIYSLRTEMNHEFDGVDQRFDEVDQRFDKVDQQFDKVDQQFDEVDQRFAKVDQRFDKVDQRFDEVDQRFDKVDQRFDEVDQRFAKVDQRFDKVDQRLDKVEQQLEQVNQRFDKVDEKFEQVDHQFEGVIQEIKNLRDWAEMITGRLQTRAGRNIENVCAGALRLGLNRPDVRPENIILRQKIKDTEGHVFKPGKEKEVDIWAHDGELLVFEVKSAPDAEDVDDFADKVELVKIQNSDKIVKGVFIAVGVEEEIRKQCRKRNIQLIPENQ